MTVAAAPFHAHQRVSASHQKHGVHMQQKSLTKVLDPRAFRARFAFYWSEFLHENYRNPEEVSVAFGVRYQTALNWWQAQNRPSGDVVALAGKPFSDWLGAYK